MKKLTKLAGIALLPLALASCGDDGLTFEQFKPVCEKSDFLQTTMVFNAPGKTNYSEVCKCIYNTHAEQKTGINTSMYSESIAVLNAMVADGSLSQTSMTKEVGLQVKCAKSSK